MAHIVAVKPLPNKRDCPELCRPSLSKLVAVFATCLSIIATFVVACFVSPMLGADERFVVPYAALSAILAGVAVIHFSQLNAPQTKDFGVALRFFAGTVALIVGFLFFDVILGYFTSAKSISENSIAPSLLSIAESTGNWFVFTNVGLWLVGCFAVACTARAATIEVIKWMRTLRLP